MVMLMPKVYRLQPYWTAAPFAGAAAGAGAMASLVLAAIVITAPHDSLSGLVAALMVFAFAYTPWLIGIVVVGGPIWWAAHRVGLRGPVVPAVLGALLVAFALTGVFTNWFGLQAVPETTEAIVNGRYLVRDGIETEYGRRQARDTFVYLGLIGFLSGGLAGLALWRIAYRLERAA